MTRKTTKARGFTLIEVLVAVSIFAVLSAMTFQALKGTLDAQERVEAHAQALAEFQIVWTILLQDLLNLARRPVRGEFGESEAAFITDTNGICPLTFTRSGLQKGMSFSRTGMQRISYCLEGDKELYRLVWPVLDRPSGMEAHKSLLLTKVDGFIVEAEDPETNCIDSSPEEGLPVGRITVTIVTEKGEMKRNFIGLDTC